jgi:hypothetical protein
MLSTVLGKVVQQIAVHPLQHHLWLGIELFSPFVPQDIEITDQHLQRRAQFVRKVGQRFHPHTLGPSVHKPLRCR